MKPTSSPLRRTVPIACLVASMTILACAPIPAAVATEPSEIIAVTAGAHTGTQPSPLYEGEREALSESLKISVEEAERRFKGQAEFLSTVTRVKETWPEKFSDSAWEASGDSAGWVSFTGPVDKTIVEEFAKMPI